MRCLRRPTRAARAHVSHIVYVKTLYRIGGQDYCRRHIIRAAVTAGVVTEVKPGGGPVVPVSRKSTLSSLMELSWDRPVDATIINRSRASPDLPELLVAAMERAWNLPITSDLRRYRSTRGARCDGSGSHRALLAAALNPS